MSSQTGQHAVFLEVTDSEVNRSEVLCFGDSEHRLPMTYVSRHTVLAVELPEVLQ